MKHFFNLILLSLIFAFLSNCSSKKFEGTYNITPKNPSPGDKVFVEYNATNTKLKDSKSIDLIVYNFDYELESTKLFPMKKVENLWEAEIVIDKNSKGIILKFEDSNNYKLIDANNNKGYFIQLYNKNGIAYPEAKASFASAIVTWGSAAGIKMDKEAAYNQMKNTIEAYPELLKKYIGNYAYSIYRLKRDEANPLIEAELNKFTPEDSLSSLTLAQISEWYSRIGQPAKAKIFLETLNSKYPNSQEVLEQEVRKIFTTNNLDHQIKLVNNFLRQNPNYKNKNQLIAQLALNLYKANKVNKVGKFILEHYKDIPSDYFYYIVQNISKSNPKLAIKILETRLPFCKNELENSTTNQPKELTSKEWKEIRTNNLGDVYLLLASALNSEKKYEDAASYYSIGFSLFEKLPEGKFTIDPNDMTKYISSLLELEKNDEATKQVEQFVSKGEANEELMNLLKKIYILNHNGEEGYEEYLSKFEAAAHQAMINKLKDEMISEPAPQFTLNTIDGREVSLADYKGKTVILDFWATWCGPCKRSFPAMQIAVNELGGDDVVFLFVNTWERVDNKLENAKKFISDNNYNFTVLLDDQNEVVTKYNVNGIPNKFVIDKNGNIKFNISGYSGNEKQTVEEIKEMINLVK